MTTHNTIFTSLQSSDVNAPGEDPLEKKFSLRAEQLGSASTNLDEIKEQVIMKDLSLKTDEREKMFREKRLKQKIKLNYSSSLKDKLTIPLNIYEECENMAVQGNELPIYIANFKANDIHLQYIGLVGIRKILSLTENAPIQDVIDSGLVSEFIKLLDHEYPEFQFEALWCTTNVTSGTPDQANSVVSKGGLAKIISLMDSKIQEIQDQAVWALGNLAGDSVKIRDRIILQKGYEKLIRLFSTAERPNLIKQCTWTMSNFCRTTPPISYSLILQAIDLIIGAIYKLDTDTDLLIDACWILNYITESYKQSIKHLIETNIVAKLITFLNHENHQIQLPCLRVIGNMASGNANQTQKIIEWGVLPYLKKLIEHPRKNIRKETCWILSNIAAGTQQQIETLIIDDFIPTLANVIDQDQPDIKKEAIWAVCNLTSVERKELIDYIINQGIIQIICKCLQIKDAKYIAVSLEAFGNLLSIGKRYFTENGKNQVVVKVEELGMFDILENLQYHPVEIVYEKTLKLLEAYFEVDNSN